LQWNPSSYEGATEIFLSSSDIWIPEFSLYYRIPRVFHGPERTNDSELSRKENRVSWPGVKLFAEAALAYTTAEKIYESKRFCCW
uniref:Neur_chan_LBD domain-containing protein n=1 Tax=Heligmosomoides polygyrus TaxID=6339 RepID=A0A183GMZ2_HELPZ